MPHFLIFENFEMPHFSYLILKLGKMENFEHRDAQDRTKTKKDNEIKGTISWVKYAILYATFLRKTIFKNDPNSN